MTVDKRTPHTDALDTLGTLIDETAKRDAVHLAVEPMVAGEDLHPGARVIVKDGVAFDCGYEGGVGIVDPFLHILGARKGQRFWLVLMPRTITSLRHVWEHPDFPAATGVVERTPDRAASEAWLRDFVSRSDCPAYEVVIAAAMQHPSGRSWDDDYLHFDGLDAHGEIDPEFWTHVEVVTGVRVPPEKRATHFSCSC